MYYIAYITVYTFDYIHYITLHILLVMHIILLFSFKSGHGFDLLSKLPILKQRMLTYSMQPSVQYYLQPCNQHMLDLRAELAQLVHMQPDIERKLLQVGRREVVDSNGIIEGNQRCVETIRKYVSAGGSLSTKCFACVDDHATSTLCLSTSYSLSSSLFFTLL